MKWVKKGLIFKAEGQHEWMAHHASVPIAVPVDDRVLRVYFGTRDVNGKSSTAFIEVEADNPRRVLYVHDRPVLSPGTLGAFDDDGAMPSCIVNRGGKKYLFYIGWNRGVTVPYRLSIGLAVSDDGGLTFKRRFEGPILSRDIADPIFVTAPFVLIEEPRWRLWYISCVRWLVVDGRPEPVYYIKRAQSLDGLRWTREEGFCLEPAFEGEAQARPCVLREDGIYRMWYSYRGSVGYRTDRRQSYRLGYAESPDGVTWSRRDEQVGIEPSASGWDSEMMEYPYVFEHKGRKHMLYNGNGFGESGFGYAVLE
jgi:hypothetical protein